MTADALRGLREAAAVTWTDIDGVELVRMPTEAEVDLQCAADARAFERDPDDLEGL